MPALSVRAPSDRLLLVVAAFAIVAGAFSPRDLWAPDEPRYGQIARETLRDGHWLVPRPTVYAEKPPIYYWLVAALSAPFGDVTAVTARLVGALCALGCLLAIQRLARRWFGAPGPPGTAVVLFAGNLLVIWNAPRAGLDLPLTCALLWAVERGGAWVRTGGAGAALATGLCWAAAILLKGPLGFLLPPAILAAEILTLRRDPASRPVGKGNVGWWLVPLVMAGTCLAWLLPAIAAGGEAYTQRLLGQIAGRVSGAEGGHVRPLYYYLLQWPAWALPVTGYLLLGAWASLKPGGAGGAARAGLRAALVAGPIFFLLLTFTATKRELYLIPGTAFVALAGAYVLHAGLWPRASRVATTVFVGALGLCAVALPVLPFATRFLLLGSRGGERAALGPVAWVALIVAALLAGWATWRAWKERAAPVLALRAAAPGMFLALAALWLGYLPAADPYKSWHPVARAAEQAAGDGVVYHAGFPQGTNLLWALDRATTPYLADTAALVRVLGPGQPRAAAVVTAAFWEAARSDPLLGGLREAWRDKTDIRELVVLTNAP
jgi:4-amino-4-deoxy-L-arabinose transferase-like glycosyltransferase